MPPRKATYHIQLGTKLTRYVNWQSIMALNRANQAVIAHRRELVASMRLRKRTEREIAQDLAKLECVNPETFQPWSVATIHWDIKALEEEWKANALTDVSTLKANQFAELQEVKRAGWESVDYNVVLRALKQEAELMGLDAEVPANLGAVIMVLGGDTTMQALLPPGYSPPLLNPTS